jgi:hypothetical protein
MDCEILTAFHEGSRSGTLAAGGLVFGWFGGAIFGAFAIIALMSRLADKWKPWPLALSITGAVAIWIVGASTALAWFGADEPSKELSFTEIYLIEERGWDEKLVMEERAEINDGKPLYSRHLTGVARDEMTYWSWQWQRKCGLRD